MSAATIAYVSDEDDVAVAGAQVEIEGPDGAVVVVSSPSGAVRAVLPAGTWDAVVAAPGHGPKRTRIAVDPDGPPHRIRLLRDRLLGYVWPKCGVTGTVGELRLHAHEGFELELVHMGWERRHVRTIGRFDDGPHGSLRRTLPDGDVARDGTGWVHRGLSDDPRVLVEAPQRSGLYAFRMRGVSGAEYSFPWVVAPAAPSAPMAVLCSDLDWNAYNDFGGRSNYISPNRLPAAPVVSPREDGPWLSDPELPGWLGGPYEPLSFDRPEPLNVFEAGEEAWELIARRGAEHVAPAEWRLLAWLDREGLPHDVWGESQLARGELDLDRYRVVVLGPHPEYWTRPMYERLLDWVERGGRLAYLGGNGIDCEVELLPDGRMLAHNGDFRRVLADPAVDSRMHLRGSSSAPLLAVATTMTGYETGAPYRVLEPGHWAFAGLDLRAGDRVGTRNLDGRCPGGASGHETDKVSPNAPPGVVLLAKGENPDDGGAHMVHHRVGAGEVFSVGSISYCTALPVDDAVSAITRNVLQRFLEPAGSAE